MKKFIIFTILLFMVLVLFQNSHASSPYVPYEVVEIQKEGILAKDHKGQLHLIKKDPGDTKVGDIIRYDYIRNRLRKSPWQLAKIIEMTESTIKLQLKNGQNLNVNTRLRYREEFKLGEEVFFDKASGKLKKSKFEEVDEE